MPERKSIAVLPLAAIAADPKLTALGNGLLEDVAAKLSQLSANTKRPHGDESGLLRIRIPVFALLLFAT